jgi:hypothetical protein
MAAMLAANLAAKWPRENWQIGGELGAIGATGGPQR